MNQVIDTPCGGTCQHLARLMGWYCRAWEISLRSGRGGPIRCYECTKDCSRKIEDKGEDND